MFSFSESKKDNCSMEVYVSFCRDPAFFNYSFYIAVWHTGYAVTDMIAHFGRNEKSPAEPGAGRQKKYAAGEYAAGEFFLRFFSARTIIACQIGTQELLNGSGKWYALRRGERK